MRPNEYFLLYGDIPKESDRIPSSIVKARLKKGLSIVVANLPLTEFEKLSKVYTSMLDRCYDPDDVSYSSYGGRGITVCEEWSCSRSAFMSWALANGWKIGLQIDRVNTNGHYSPYNCRFVTCKENNRNRRTNRMVEIVDGEVISLAEAVEKYGVVSLDTAKRRLYMGWTDKAAVIMPNLRYYKDSLSKAGVYVDE